MRRKLLVVSALVAVCALAAVATALAASAGAHHSAATRKSTHAGESSAEGAGGPPGGGWGGGGPGAGPAVHSESVVLDKAGTEFITVTSDSGTVKGVEASAGKLTVLEAAKSVTYKTVTLTIPSGATVTLDGKSSTLESLAEGDHVSVSSSSEGTTVQAFDSSFKPEGGPHGGPGHGGPPPGGAQPPTA